MVHTQTRATSGSRIVNNFLNPSPSSSSRHHQEQHQYQRQRQHAVDEQQQIGGYNHSKSKLMKKKRFDKDRFIILIAKHKELTEQNNLAHSHSWRRNRVVLAGGSIRDDNIDEGDARMHLSKRGGENDGNGNLHSSLNVQSKSSLTNKSRRIHRKRSLLQTPSHDRRRNEIMVAHPSSILLAANPSARTALAELGTKYNLFSHSGAADWNDTHVSDSNHQASCKTTEDELEPGLEYSYDLMTAVESEESDKMSTAMLMTSLDESDSLSKVLVNKVISVHITEAAAASSQSLMEKESRKCDDNVDYLLQLRTLIGKERRASISDDEAENSSSHSIDDHHVESYHSSLDERFEFGTYENDHTSVLSPLTYEYAHLSEKDGPFNNRCTMFRWCVLVWMLSLVLVYERCLSNEIYLISHWRRTLEQSFGDQIARFRIPFDSMRHKSKHQFDMERHSSLRSIKLAEDVLSSDTEFNTVFANLVEDHRSLNVFNKRIFSSTKTRHSAGALGDHVFLDFLKDEYFHRSLSDILEDSNDLCEILHVPFATTHEVTIESHEQNTTTHQSHLYSLPSRMFSMEARPHQTYTTLKNFTSLKQKAHNASIIEMAKVELDEMACVDPFHGKESESHYTLSSKFYSSGLEFSFYFDMTNLSTLSTSKKENDVLKEEGFLDTTDVSDLVLIAHTSDVDMTTKKIEVHETLYSDQFWTERSLEFSFLPTNDDTDLSLVDPAVNPMTKETAPSKPMPSSRKNVEYSHSQHHVVNGDVPIIDIIFDFFRNLRKKRKQKKKQRKRHPKHVTVK